MKRSKETTVNKDGRFNRNGRYGKSISYHAPAMLVGIVKQKAPQEGGALYEVDTFTFRASQYNHVNDTYIKKTRDERTTFVGMPPVRSVTSRLPLEPPGFIHGEQSEINAFANDTRGGRGKIAVAFLLHLR